MRNVIPYIPIATTVVALAFSVTLVRRWRQKGGTHVHSHAIRSAVHFARRAETRYRAQANALIAVGALLPGIGGSFTRFGHTEVLYVTEFIGLVLIYLGYRLAVRGAPRPEVAPHVHVAQFSPSR